jgi:pimeloyl-ACP methyl ester carboxylesterase
MDRAVETLEEWAAKKALELDAAGWLEVNAVLDYIDPTKPNVVGYSVGGSWITEYAGPWPSIERAVAIGAFRDGVVGEIRDAGWPPRDSDSLLGRLLEPPARHAWLEDRGLLVAGEGPFCTRTDFGDEVARVLRGEASDA